MLKAELLEIIANGENSGIEFKRDDIRPEQLAKEVVAFANAHGGRILLGVDDDGSIVGVQRNNLQEWVMHVMRDKVHPSILPIYEVVEMDAQRHVVVLTLPSGFSKPHMVRDRGEEKAYIRLGATCQLATREQQMRLFEEGGLLHIEALPVPGTDMRCLDDARLMNYLRDFIKDPELPITQEQWQQRLLGLGFLVESNEHIFCTIAGLALFGKNPRRYLRNSGLRVMVFAGNDKDYQAKLDRLLDGPLVGRWDLSAGKRVIDGGLIDQFIELIKPFISEEAAEIDAHFRRELTWFYPLDAVRELVVNALAHRDWTRSVEVEVGVYNDRLEVISPGALRNSMTLEKMLAGQRSARNNLTVDVLRDYGYVEGRGMGIRTKVVPQMRQLNHCDPIFEATEDYLKAVLPKRAAS